MSWDAGGMGLASHPCLQGKLGAGGLPEEVSQRPHLDMFLKPAWKTFSEDFLFASKLLPDTDSIFWENARPL